MNRLLTIGTLIMILFSCEKVEENPLNVAVAANMQFAMKEIAYNFSEKTGEKVQLMVSSSGKLNAQIKEGAPYDIFVSADMKYPQDLYEAGFSHEPPKVYAYGNLVLWSAGDEVEAQLKTLEDSNIKHIAMANPKLAPYGIAALEVLKHYQLVDSIEDKLVFGESVSQCNQFILSKSADLGFTAKSVVLSPQMKNQGNWIDIDVQSYTPIAQGMVIVKHENRNEELSKEFYQYLLSEEAQEILLKFGYNLH